MKLKHAFVCLGVAAIVLFLSRPSVFAATSADDYSAEELHSLYRSGQYFECYRASAVAAKNNPRAALPYFYAALSLSRSEEDGKMSQVSNPYGKALHFLEVAKTNDPAGRQLSGVRKGLAVVQKALFEKAAMAYGDGKTGMRDYFDRMAAVFNKREGLWKNYYHHGQFLAHEDYDFSQWDNPFYRLADTGKDVCLLTREQRQILYLHNLCRMNPQLFRDTYLKKYLGDHPVMDYYVTTLLDELSKAQPQLPLFPDPQLIQAARGHADDLAKHRIFQHESSDGTSFSDRIRKVAKDRSYCGENCAAGYNDALTCFMGLLIDRGVESLGHRHSILSGGFRRIGIGVVAPPDQWKIWVFDFSGS